MSNVENYNSLYNKGNGNISDKFSDDIINILPGTFSIISAEGKILKWNKKLADVFGFSNEEIAAIGPLGFFDEKDHALISDKIVEAFTSGYAEVEVESVTKNKQKIHFLYTANAIQYLGQSCIAVIGIDISAKKSEELKFKRLIENSLVGAAIMQNNKFVYVNARYAEIFGYTQQEMLDKNPVDFLVFKPDVESVKEHVQDRIDGIVETAHYETRAIRKDGSIVWVEVHGRLANYNGEPAIMGNILDITARKELQNEQSIFASIVDSSLDAILSINLDGFIGTWNKGAENVFGHLANEVIGKHVFILIPEERQHEEIEILTKIRNGQTVELYETKRLTKDGRLIDISLTVSPLKDVVGTIIGATKIARDITEKRKSEKEILEREQRYNNALQGIEAGVWDYYDLENRLLLLSPRYLQLMGRVYEDRPYTQEELESWIDPDDYKLSEVAFIDYLSNKTPHYKIDLRYIMADGSKRWFSNSGKAAYDSEGNLLRIVGSIIDIHEKKIAEEAIRVSEETQRLVMESSLDAVICINMKGEIILWSKRAEETFGWTEAEAKGKTLAETIIPEKYREQHAIGFKHYLASNSGPLLGKLIEIAALNKAGQEFPVEMSIVSIGNGNDRFACGFLRDISVRKATEMQKDKLAANMLQRNKDLEQFAYIVSHNLRAPVANIIGFAEIFNDTSYSIDEKQVFADHLATSANKLDGVIKDLNYILQVKQEISERKESVSFSSLVSDIENSIINMINKEKVTIRANFSAIDEVVTIKSYLYSIFYNLITNSIKYRRKGIAPVIEITSKLNKDSIAIVVEDNGMGIDLTQKGEQVFGLYKRFHTQAAEGKGMGLYMTKTQVEAIGGKIFIASEVNEGTVFTIELPV
ncbi:MAG: PAS domain S-box protein [Sphingobacteriales bacterium JAD_PAG50586_3]|nr:MAG: PAS domain S-box protein [Sphingobacteriales bacterium JAD_PAG50586_3]